MGAIASGTMIWAYRAVMTLAMAGLMLGPGQGLWPGQGSGLLSGRAVAAEPTMLLVSRKRLLNDTNQAKTLLKAEIALTAELQSRIDTIKAELNAEEQELTRLRKTLERAEFDARVAEFDIKVRRQRREAQRSAAALQNLFRAERLKLVKAIDPLLEEVRAAYGASVILNADQVLTSDPALDVTDEVLAKFNTSVTLPSVPDLDDLIVDQPPTPGGTSTSE